MNSNKMKELTMRRFSLPPINPRVLYVGNGSKFDDFEYPSMTERGRSMFASFAKKPRTSESGLKKIAAPLIVSHSIRPKVMKIIPKRKRKKKKKFMKRSTKVDNVLARLYNPQKNGEGEKRKIKLKMRNSGFFSRSSRYFNNRKQMKMKTSEIGVCDKKQQKKSLPKIRCSSSRFTHSHSSPTNLDKRRHSTCELFEDTSPPIQGIPCLRKRNRTFKREMKPVVKIAKRIKSPNFSYPSLFYTPIRLEFPNGYHFEPHITHAERITKEVVNKISGIYQSRFLTYFRGYGTKKKIPTSGKFDETMIQNLDFPLYQDSYRKFRFPRSFNRVSSLPFRMTRRKVQKRLSELRLESFLFKNKKRINCSNVKKYIRLQLEIASLQESLGIFEEANATYERVLVLLSEHSSRASKKSVFRPEILRRLNQCVYNRIGVNYMLLFLFEERNVEKRQHYYINASFYMKMCLGKYILKDEDVKIRSATLTNLGLINLYIGDEFRASMFFKECLGFPFIKKKETGFHPSDDMIVGPDQLIALSNLLITMFSSGDDDIGVEILSQNMFLDVTCLAKNRVSSIIYLLLNSLTCMFQKDIVGGEKKLQEAKNMLTRNDPSFLESFIKEVSQSFVILK